MRISDWSSDVCSSDLQEADMLLRQEGGRVLHIAGFARDLVHPQQRPPDERDPPSGGGGGGGDRRQAGDVAGEAGEDHPPRTARKSVVEGKSVAVRGSTGGRRILKKKKNNKKEK